MQVPITYSSKRQKAFHYVVKHNATYCFSARFTIYVANMRNAIVFIIFLLLATCKSTAMATGIKYYTSREDVTYDTIPYMVKDSYFIKGFHELRLMLNGEIPYSLKRAEFILEWAYSGGKMNYAKFCNDIDSVARILKRFIEVNNIQQYKTAPNYALFEYFTKPSPMNGNKAFRYDFEDCGGRNDFKKLFVTKVMDTHTGQCVSLPIYYKILCDELGGQSSLALAPQHMYVKHIGEDGKWVNIELTNGNFVRDEWIIQTTNVSTEAIRNGVFLSALSDKENIAFLMTLLGRAYLQKYSSWDYFPLRCVEEVLKVLPNFCEALLLKLLTHQQFSIAYQKKYGRVFSHFLYCNYAEFRRMIDTLDILGYSQQTEEEYKACVEKVLKEIENETKK